MRISDWSSDVCSSDLHIHPAIREKIADHGAAIIAEVQAAVAAHDIVVVGMGINPFPRKARRLLTARGLAHHYLEYGSYLSDWRSEEHTSELQSLMRISYAVFCLKKKNHD